MKQTRVAAAFRFTELALKLLAKLATEAGTSRTAVLERLIREEARRRRIKADD